MVVEAQLLFETFPLGCRSIEELVGSLDSVTAGVWAARAAVTQGKLLFRITK